MQYLAHVYRSLSVGTLPVHQMRWDWGFIIICVKICKSLFSEDKCVLILPILDPYSSHMTLPMWVQHGTLLQIPHESLMGCPYRTHINTHLGPMWVLYCLLAGCNRLIKCLSQPIHKQIFYTPGITIFRIF